MKGSRMKGRQMMLVILAVVLCQGVAWAEQSLLAGDRQVVANEGKIGDKWMLAEGTTLAVAAYPPPLAARGDDACVALGYQINENGTTSDFAVLKQWNSATGEDEPQDGYWQQFAQAGADALSQWRFQARPGVDVVRPTYTVATIAFQGGKGQSADVGSHCRIGDLAGLLQERKSKNYMKHSRERHDVDRANHAARRSSAMRENPATIRPRP